MRLIGRVRNFNPYKKYGFIETDTTKNIFVHGSKVVGGQDLEQDAVVTFILVERVKGRLAAEEVEVIR